MFERSIMKDLRKWADNPYRKLFDILFIGCFAGGIVEVIVSFCLLIGRVLPPHWQKFAKGVARGWQNFSLIVSVLPLWTIVEF